MGCGRAGMGFHRFLRTCPEALDSGIRARSSKPVCYGRFYEADTVSKVLVPSHVIHCGHESAERFLRKTVLASESLARLQTLKVRTVNPKNTMLPREFAQGCPTVGRSYPCPLHSDNLCKPFDKKHAFCGLRRFPVFNVDNGSTPSESSRAFINPYVNVGVINTSMPEDNPTQNEKTGSQEIRSDELFHFRTLGAGCC